MKLLMLGGFTGSGSPGLKGGCVQRKRQTCFSFLAVQALRTA